MGNIKETDSFLGVGWSFPPAFHKPAYGVSMIAGETDIQSSLHILLTTRIGERIMQPTYGCDLTKFLFEPIDTTFKTFLKDIIETAILYHEPRIILNGIKIDTEGYIEGKLVITVEYTIAATNARNNFVYPFYLNEGSNINK
jgi:phage baseplate assembly protein W